MLLLVVIFGIVEVSLSETTIFLIGKAEGVATVTVKDVVTGSTDEISVTVKDAYTGCPDGNHPHLIDLGLPSGTKWACCNVGADKPEAYGGYYAWGETEEKDVYYNESTYKYSYVNIGSDISGTEYDVAHVKWGGKWCMPTYDEQKELQDNCTREWTTINGVNGSKFTSKINGNSIFLPAAGYRWDNRLESAIVSHCCWSSTRDPDYPQYAYFFYFYSGYGGSGRTFLFSGRSVRPVVRN